MPLYAHTELRLAATADLLDEAERDWLAQRGDQDLQDAYRAWFRGPERSHPAAPYDLNILAHQLVESGRPSLAYPVFEAIGPYATTAPWAQAAQRSGARGGREAFLAARGAAEATAVKAPRNDTEPDPFPETAPVRPAGSNGPSSSTPPPTSTLTSPE